MPPHPPAPGVREVGSRAAASPVREVRPPDRKGRRTPEQDIRKNRKRRGRKEIAPPDPVTLGVTPAKNRSILEVPLDIGTGEFGVAKFTSADGETYRLRYGTASRDGGMKLLPNAVDKLQWATFREIVLKTPGAEAAMSIFSAMKLKMDDEDGKQLFPITIDMLRNARAGLPGVTADTPYDRQVADHDPGFSIGVEEGD